MDSWEMFEVCPTAVPEDPGFSTFFWYIYRKNKFTDVVFELQTPDGPTSFSAHKLILSLWSPKFADMFYSTEGQNGPNLVSLKNIDPQAFGDMLKSMYGCEPVLEHFEEVCNLFKVATEFEVTNLANLCLEFLGKIGVDATNVFEVIEMAQTLGDETLMRKCKEIIQKQTKDVISFNACCDIFPSALQIILDSPELSLDSEYDLLIWMGSLVDHPRHSSTREVLQEFLPRLQFLELTNTEFAKIYKIYQQFFDDEEALSIFMNIAIRGSHPLPSWYGKDLKSRVYKRH